MLQVLEYRRHPRTILAPALVLVLLTCCGCGDGRPSRVPVSGQVLIDGQPLKCGYIRFVPADHRPSQGNIDANGRFTLSCFEENDGVVIGRHNVAVRATEMVNERLMRWHAPKKYAETQTSGLTQEITGPTDKLIINLTWDGEKPFDEKYELPIEPGGEGKY